MKKYFFSTTFHVTNIQSFWSNSTQQVHFTDTYGILMQKGSNMQWLHGDVSKKHQKQIIKPKHFFDQKNKIISLWKTLEQFFILFMSYIKIIVKPTKLKKKIMLQSINYENCGYHFCCILINHNHTITWLVE